MSDRIGMGLANFPFSDVATMWRWIDLCEEHNVDSIWQTDRLISTQPMLESMTFMAATGRADRKAEVWHERGRRRLPRPTGAGQAVRDD